MKERKSNFFSLFFIVVYSFAAMGLLASLALNMSFLSPVSQTMKSFSITDVYYHVLMENGTRDTSRIITIVDMTDLPDRASIAEKLEEIESMNPKVIGVDIVFEGWKPDTLADMKLIELAQKPNIVYSYRLTDYINDSVGYDEIHSFFSEVVEANEGFTNFERSLYNETKRKISLKQRVNGEDRTSSLVGDVALQYTDGQLDTHGASEVAVNYRPTVFRMVHPDSIAQHRDWIEDHIVLYGATHELSDMHYTPLGKIAGIELLAYSIQTLIEQTEVRTPPLWITILVSFLIVLVTYLWKTAYMNWAKSRKSEWLRFFLTTTFVVGLLLFFWSALLVWIGFLVFYLTDYNVNMGWGMAAIPFLSGAAEFFQLTFKRYKKTDTVPQKQNG